MPKRQNTYREIIFEEVQIKENSSSVKIEYLVVEQRKSYIIYVFTNCGWFITQFIQNCVKTYRNFDFSTKFEPNMMVHMIVCKIS